MRKCPGQTSVYSPIRLRPSAFFVSISRAGRPALPWIPTSSLPGGLINSSNLILPKREHSRQTILHSRLSSALPHIVLTGVHTRPGLARGYSIGTTALLCTIYSTRHRRYRDRAEPNRPGILLRGSGMGDGVIDKAYDRHRAQLSCRVVGF